MTLLADPQVVDGHLRVHAATTHDTPRPGTVRQDNDEAGHDEANERPAGQLTRLRPPTRS
jgi:hypothetical protein